MILTSILSVIGILIMIYIANRLGRVEEDISLIKQTILHLPVESLPHSRHAIKSMEATRPPVTHAEPTLSHVKPETHSASATLPEESGIKAPVSKAIPKSQTLFDRYQQEKAQLESKLPCRDEPEKSNTMIEQETKSEKPKYGLEQWLGLRGALVAGIITTLIGAGLFLKYIYDQSFMGPVGRIALTAGGGLLCIGIGEFTRRKNFGLVAQGLTALGFAILFAAVFTANHFYQILGVTPAFMIASLITIVAMSYAVCLRDVLAAFVALLGGYLTPVILQSNAGGSVLFVYVSLLSIGALACAWYRNWRIIHWQAFIGAFILYGLWYNNVPVHPGIPDSQFKLAVVWLGVFFLIFLVMPVLHELVRKVRSGWSDGVLLLVNAALTFGFYYHLLEAGYRTGLAWIAVVLFGIHLGLRQLIHIRYPDDTPLKSVLLTIALLFAGLAVPLYFNLYSSMIAWSFQAVIILFIARRYQNRLCEVAALALGLIQIITLISALPLHHEAIQPFFNRAWLAAFSVFAGYYLMHWIYRQLGSGFKGAGSVLMWLCMAVAWIGLLGISLTEWHDGCRYDSDLSVALRDIITFQGHQVIMALFLVILAAWPVRPRNENLDTIVSAAALSGCLVSLYYFYSLYEMVVHRYPISGLSIGWLFLNPRFLTALCLPVATLISGLLIYWQGQSFKSANLVRFIFMVAVIGLWVLITEELYFHFKLTGMQSLDPDRGLFLGQMAISIAWAIYSFGLMAIGFWKQFRAARYASLAILVLTLGKVFLLDMSHLGQVYRIAGVVVLGVILLVVAFLYQYARNKGVFHKEPATTANQRSTLDE